MKDRFPLDAPVPNRYLERATGQKAIDPVTH